MKVALYCRVSTNEKKQDITLQTDPLEAYASRQGWDYQTIIEYASAKDTDHRPKWKDMMYQATHLKLFDAVAVTKLDRFSRSLIDFINAVQDLDRNGVRFIAIDQGIDTDKRNPISRVLMHILAALSELERGIIAERVKAGIAKRKSKGLPVGRQRRIMNVEEAIGKMEVMSARKAAKAMGVDVNTLLRRVKLYQNAN